MHILLSQRTQVPFRSSDRHEPQQMTAAFLQDECSHATLKTITRRASVEMPIPYAAPNSRQIILGGHTSPKDVIKTQLSDRKY